MRADESGPARDENTTIGQRRHEGSPGSCRGFSQRAFPYDTGGRLESTDL
jgi:hypothetical protein